jgi:hypothetical protein
MSDSSFFIDYNLITDLNTQFWSFHASCRQSELNSFILIAVLKIGWFCAVNCICTGMTMQTSDDKFILEF